MDNNTNLPENVTIDDLSLDTFSMPKPEKKSETKSETKKENNKVDRAKKDKDNEVPDSWEDIA